MRARGGLSLLVLVLTLIPALAFAGDVADYSSVFLSNTSERISGPGLSKDGFLNSLTDVSGLLNDFKPGHSDSVRIDSTKVQGNQLSVDAEVWALWWHDAPVSGHLQYRQTGCSGSTFGGTFTFLVNNPQRVRSVKFVVCARSNPDNSLSVSIRKSLIAGPEYTDQAAPVITQIFGTADEALYQHTLAYVDQTGGAHSNLAADAQTGAYGLGNY